MSFARALPLIFSKTDATKFPVAFKFALHSDLCVTCVTPSGQETALEEGRHYTVQGGGEDRSGCVSDTGSICLTCPMPDCTIVIEHYPQAVAISPSVKPLGRKDAEQAFRRMQAQIDALSHRLTLAPSLPISNVGGYSLLSPPEYESDGLWLENAVCSGESWSCNAAFINDGEPSFSNIYTIGVRNDC